ncbi:MAG: monovalent cation/H+ antiporter complex subunit F [Candidatus Hadarchaeales archaeon]
MIELIVIYVMIAAGVMCALRAALGPTAPDRVVGIDALIAISISVLVLLGFHYRAQIYLDVALVYAMLAFIGSLAVAKYLDSGELGS